MTGVWTSRWSKYVAALVMIALAVPGALLVAGALDHQEQQASDTDAAREEVCAGRIDRLVSALDSFAEQFDGLSALGTQKVPPMPSMDQLREEAGAFRTELAQTDCDESEARDAIEQWRDDVGGRGALARAVRAAMAANVLAELADADQPVRRRLQSGDDLESALERLPAGATVVLPAGRFRLDRTLAVIQDLTIVGAGAGRTHGDLQRPGRRAPARLPGEAADARDEAGAPRWRDRLGPGAARRGR